MIKIAPNNIYNTAAAEAWLEEQAKDGLLIKSINNFFCAFEKTEPKELFFRMIPTDKDSRKFLSEEKAEEYSRKGVECACTFSDKFHIFYSEDREDFEILGEPVQLKKDWKKLLKDAYFYLLLSLFVIISMAVMIFIDISKNGAFLYNIIKHRYWALQLGVIILSAVFANKMRINAKYIKKSIKSAGENTYPFWDGDEDSLKYSKKTIISVILSLAVMFSLTFHSYINSWHKNLDHISKTMPMLFLNVVEQDESFRRYNPASIGDGLVRDTNSGKFSYSILAPKQYMVNQTGIIDGKTFENSKKQYIPSSDVDFLRLSLPFLTKPIYNDLLKTYNFLADEPECEVIEITDSGFDKAVIYSFGKYELFFGYVDNNVIYLSYEGNKTIRPFVEEIYQSIEYLEF